MTAQPQKKKTMTQAEYLVRERSSLDIKHEFFNGDVFAMVGAGRNHNRININLAGELRNKFKAGQFACDLFSNDMRVKIDGSYAYPDIVIFCGDAQFEDNEFDTLTNPVVIMEILSDSTESFDRGISLLITEQSLRIKNIFLFSQKKYRVEQFIRDEEGRWEYRSYEKIEQSLKIESVNCELPLSDIYLNVKFESK